MKPMPKDKIASNDHPIKLICNENSFPRLPFINFSLNKTASFEVISGLSANIMYDKE